MGWEVVPIIIALFGFVVAIVKPISSLTSSITKLTVVVETLQNDVVGIKSRSSDSHSRIWKHNDEQDERIEDHETRISIMEKQNEQGGLKHEN